MATVATMQSLHESLVNHLVLPPRVPGREDRNELLERAFMDRLIAACKQLRVFSNNQKLDSLHRTIFTAKLLQVNAQGKLNKSTMMNEFRTLDFNVVLVLYVLEQNAALLISRHQSADGDRVSFEAFEASASAEDVLASETSTLIQDFPGYAASIPISTFEKPQFIEELAALLEQASVEPISRFAARSNKANALTSEIRDTVDPALITQMLMTLVEANGRREYPRILRKRVRDDVCWDNAEKPWRRSSVWLVIRVAIQRHLCMMLGGHMGRVYYKFLTCLLLARLLEEGPQLLSIESLAFLKTKVCRRLAKLEIEQQRELPGVCSLYEQLFQQTRPIFRRSVDVASKFIDTAWTNFKTSNLRPIMSLPRRASDRDLYLTLPNSGRYLQQVLAEGLHPIHPSHNYKLPSIDISAIAKEQISAFSNRYFILYAIEAGVEPNRFVPTSSKVENESHCKAIATQIKLYLAASNGAYTSNLEAMSGLLLNIMELWIAMDKHAIALYPLLKQFSPYFTADMLDVIHCPTSRDLHRLKTIQEYLHYRQSASGHITIFEDPRRGCFAERYFSESEDSSDLRDLMDTIEQQAASDRERKEKEHQRVSAEYDGLMRTVAESACIYKIDDFQVRTHDDKSCTKCFLTRKARRLRITVYEHPLPSNEVHAKVVVFELTCPKAFALYRDITWTIISSLASPKKPVGAEPIILIRDYQMLRAFVYNNSSALTLGSTTKSFEMTHYGKVRLPVDLEDVFKPNALKLGYFDPLSNLWPGRHCESQKATFVQHFDFLLPKTSPFCQLMFAPEMAANGAGPSSYEVLASQTKTPPGLNVHEYMSFKSLLAGKTRRLTQLLVELGSQNLNFSTEATATLVTRLVHEAGPACEDGSALRIVHHSFHDKLYCTRLIEQLRMRLDNISSNGRENFAMDIILTLILRLLELGPSVIIAEASVLLLKARSITESWMQRLRVEVNQATDADTARRCSRYALWAALLCRRTFAIHLQDNTLMDGATLRSFIECSITVQDNLIDDPSQAPLSLKNAIMRDLKILYKVHHLLRESLKVNQDAFMSAISVVWPQPEGRKPRTASSFRFLDKPNDLWLEAHIDAAGNLKQHVINYSLFGHLLVDGKPLGQLPAEYRTSKLLKELFGDTTLLTYPSSLRGSSFTLNVTPNGHQIHLGFRAGNLVVRATVRGKVLELIPREIFESTGPTFDLPLPLVSNCLHWLDLATGVLEIRQMPAHWINKPSNWQLNVRTRMANRRTVYLVDPCSSTFRRVQRIFDYFEYPRELTVFQPASRNLTVELKRLSLSFSVNSKKLLESSQLRAEVDPNQDCGTWYGLRSKLILRDTSNDRLRSILVPMSGSEADSIKYRHHGIHVNIDIVNYGTYGRYFINDVLGRLDCPAEPWLLYQKAMIFAYSSFILPDPLTQRTGTEEALACLNSGLYQPWAPLTLAQHSCLIKIAHLSPKREYYPRDGNTLQRVYYNDHLTTSIQYDGYFAIVQGILDHHEKLNQFASQKVDLPRLPSTGDREKHLVRRSCSRLSLFTRYSQVESCKVDDVPIYCARDRWRSGQNITNVLESVGLIIRWPQNICTTKDLVGLLQSFPNITGFFGNFNKILLTDRLNFDIAQDFGSLWNSCRTACQADAFHLMFLFATLSFRSDIDMCVIRCLIACAILEDLKVLTPPPWSPYVQFRHNQIPSLSYISQLLKPFRIPYGQDARHTFNFNLNAKQRRALEGAETAYEKQTDEDCQIFAQFLLEQWPCVEPTIEGFSTTVQVDIGPALQIIRPEWERLFQNMELSNFLQHVQAGLDKHESEERFVPPHMQVKTQEVFPSRCRGREIPTSADLMLRPGPTFSIPSIKKVQLHPQKSENVKKNVSGTSQECLDLEAIIKHITNSASSVRRTYGQELMLSLESFKLTEQSPKNERKIVDPLKLSSDIDIARDLTSKAKENISNAFSDCDPTAGWLQSAGLWPCMSTIVLLQNLGSTSGIVYGDRMKQCLINFALRVTRLQRLLRLEAAFRKGDLKALVEEQNNPGHEGWDPWQENDWLLLEIESNILIRREQVDVALATISPASSQNSVLQMNMGQGKTSVIIPMVALKLADGKSLMRVIIPKPLLLQTAQLMQGRLGGILGRSVLHLPFSRKTSTSHQTIKAYFNMHECILKSSGVVLALPEHILSFQLSGLQGLSDNRVNEGIPMVNVQSWLESRSRDVIDESDQILSLRTQLIYPSGNQKTVDGSPHRWETIQKLLHLVESHLFDLRNKFPHSIEVIHRDHGGYPMFYFLRKDVEDALLNRLVGDICNGRTSILNIGHCTRADCLAIRQFISQAKVKDAVAKHIKTIFPDKPNMKQNLFLLRGLFVHRILLLTLKKRWQVQYGLHPERDPIAVPYHSKGVPSEQAEFGYPDVALTLTCLAFYYEGLNTKQFKQALEHVLKSDDPSAEWNRWTESTQNNLPDALREWNSINLDDEMHMMELFRHLRFTVTIIDYFLNNFAFPGHAKQLAVKLQASGWDIPLPSSAGNSNTIVSPTTGFSGTNDNRSLLPETIKQQDLHGLQHTNAEVLTYLLQERNRNYILAANSQNGGHISEYELLRKISAMKIRVLIDAGAQILELDNASLAKAWLDIDNKLHNGVGGATASCYIDESGKACVIQKGCRPVPLFASPYAESLDDVLVFIDEAHCRGLDLKFPANARGALTLGPGQTKDQTVQAAMRLRQLATTQSIVFFSPPEVHQQILDVRNKTHNDLLNSYDVVCWLLEQTCKGIEQLQPLYYAQGMDYCRRIQARVDCSDFLSNFASRETYLNTIRQAEQQSLEQLYGIKPRVQSMVSSGALSNDISVIVKKLKTRRKGFVDTGDAVHSSALQEVEQEREVAYEIEAVRQVQRPVHYQAHIFPGLEKDIASFARTGRLPADSMSFEQVFLAMRKTGVGSRFNIRDEALSSRLFVSREYLRSVSVTGRPHDNFLRPVNWILWSVTSETALVLIPEEAELIIPIVRKAEIPATYLLCYAAPITRKMLHFNNLRYYSIPQLPKDWTAPIWLTTELGVFAGRLYFEFAEYSSLCQFLGFEAGEIIEEIASDEPTDSKENHDVADGTIQATDSSQSGQGRTTAFEGVGKTDENHDSADGVVDATDSAEHSKQKLMGITSKPLTFMQEWLTVRRKGQEFTHTPMGWICQGKPLAASPFFSKQEPVSNGAEVPTAKHAFGTKGHYDQNDDLYDDDGAWAEMGTEELLDGESDSDSEYFSPDESTGSSSEAD